MQKQMAKKWVKLKQSTTPPLCNIRDVMVNRQVKTPRTTLEEDPFITFWVFLTVCIKNIVNKSVFQSNFSFINP